jgi:hypothetical protein
MQPASACTVPARLPLPCPDTAPTFTRSSCPPKRSPLCANSKPTAPALALPVRANAPIRESARSGKSTKQISSIGPRSASLRPCWRKPCASEEIVPTASLNIYEKGGFHNRKSPFSFFWQYVAPYTVSRTQSFLNQDRTDYSSLTVGNSDV